MNTFARESENLEVVSRATGAIVDRLLVGKSAFCSRSSGYREQENKEMCVV